MKEFVVQRPEWCVCLCVYSPTSSLKMIWRFQNDPQISRGLSPRLGMRIMKNRRESHEYLSISFKTETIGFTVAFKGYELHTLVQNSHLLLFKPCYNSLTATKQRISSSVLQHCGKSGLNGVLWDLCPGSRWISVCQESIWVFEDITPVLFLFFFF